jgi:transposase
MRKIIQANIDQSFFFAPCIDEWIGPEHPARFVHAFVQAQNLAALGLDTLKREEGGAAFEPALLLGVWLYGYFRGISSHRKLELACREEMGFLWLSGNTRPDHNALWRYWDTHHPAMRALFKQTIKLACEMDMVGFVEQALDGTKIQARCSAYGSYNKKSLEKRLAHTDERIAQLEAQIKQAGEEASAALPKQLQGKQTLKLQIQHAIEELAKGGREHVHPKENEAQRMKTDKGCKFGHNAQAMVDEKQNIIVEAAIAGEPTDQHQLSPMLEQARQTREELGVQASPLTKADTGYATLSELQKAKERADPVQTPPPIRWSDISAPHHSAHFTYDEKARVVRCPQGNELKPGRKSNKSGREVVVYSNAAACAKCPMKEKCTPGSAARRIEVCAYRKDLEQLARNYQTREYRQSYQRRSKIVEPVFARIKQHLGFRRWGYFGRTKVQSQWQMLCSVFNLKQIYRKWKGQGLRHESAGAFRTSAAAA